MSIYPRPVLAIKIVGGYAASREALNPLQHVTARPALPRNIPAEGMHAHFDRFCGLRAAHSLLFHPVL